MLCKRSCFASRSLAYDFFRFVRRPLTAEQPLLPTIKERNQGTRLEVNFLMLRVTRNAKSVICLLILLASVSLFCQLFEVGVDHQPVATSPSSDSSRAKVFPKFLSVAGIRLGMSRQEVTQLLSFPTGAKVPWTAYGDVFVVYENDMVIALMGRRLEHKGVAVSIGNDGLLSKDDILIHHWKRFLWNDCLLGPPTYFGRDSSNESKYHYGARYEDLKLTLTERNYQLICILEPSSSLERYEGGVP